MNEFKDQIDATEKAKVEKLIAELEGKDVAALIAEGSAKLASVRRNHLLEYLSGKLMSDRFVIGSLWWCCRCLGWRCCCCWRRPRCC